MPQPPMGQGPYQPPSDPFAPQPPYGQGGYPVYPTPQGPPPGNRQFPSIVALFMCLAPRVWRDAGRNWRGIGFFYLLLLEAIFWTAIMVPGYFTFSRYVVSEAPAYLNQVPDMTFTNGKLTIDKPCPYYIVNPKTGKNVVMFDTTGKTQTPPEGVAVLFTDSTMFQQEPSGRVTPHSLVAFGTRHIDKNDVSRWLDKAQSLFLPVGLPAMIVVSTLGRLVWVLLLAAIGMAFISSYNAQLSYAASMRLAAIALTPVTLIDLVLHFVPVLNAFPCAWLLIGIGLEVAVLAVAVKANVPRQNQFGGGLGGQWPGMPPPQGY